MATRVRLAIILALAAVSLWVAWPSRPANYLPGFVPWPHGSGVHLRWSNWSFVRDKMKLGLDLQGGTNIVLQVDFSGHPESEWPGLLEGTRRIIEKRINPSGVGETLIQTQGNDRILVQLPGVENAQEAVNLIGQTAKLDFRKQALDANGLPQRDPNGEVIWIPATAIGSDGIEKPLDGTYLKSNATVRFNPTSNLPEIDFEFNKEGALLMKQITAELVRKEGETAGKLLGIFLDNELISGPSVEGVIEDRGQITGMELREARTLVIQLNAGALRAPVSVVQQSDVDATLGADSIRKSLLAGEIGLGLVLVFMVLYYRLPGAVAGLALLFYAVLLLAIFKLIPVTLTLSGIAAFILSVGMAVDANILIFERMKEELLGGRTLRSAVDVGFGRAWNSIRDSNVSTMITCGILLWFGNNFGSPLVMGFALTLLIGVVVSMFTAIFVSRTFLHLIVSTPWAANTSLFAADIPARSAAESVGG